MLSVHELRLDQRVQLVGSEREQALLMMITINPEQDKLTRALARLTGLKQNLAQHRGVEEVFVDEYHAILDELNSLGFDLDEFRIPTELLTHRVTSWNVLSGRKAYSQTRSVGGDYFSAKLDALIMYFQTAGERRYRTHSDRLFRTSEGLTDSRRKRGEIA